tara:strand:+ start:11734 stop:12504 length:771 start_codon:yes stop_codon:yes gene_type:complete
MNKFHFVFDKIKKNIKVKKFFLKKYKNYSVTNSNVIVVFGGDGFMLHTLKKYQKYKKNFYGFNMGTFGFLMNKFSKKNLYKYISRAKLITISPLQMKVVTKSNKSFTAIAINEVSLLRQSKQTASLQIDNKRKSLIKKLISDGVLVSTPAGSTAYNLSVNGPILSLNSKKIAITPISPFRPRRWKGKVVSASSIINIKNLNIYKRPISIVADNKEVRNVKKVTIKVNNAIKFKLLYNKNSSLVKKIKLEQIKRNIN